MSEFGVKIIQFTNMNPVFKGSSVAIVGLLALLFAMWMRARWKEPLKGGFIVFIGLAVFIVFYGLYILIFQPQWWKLPY
jgi:uncharacterized membrane protein HdeD (DUF308 family)